MWGIGRSDIIYEVKAEGATTRMLAFYQDFAPIPKIGSVRSTRPYYLELALAYDAVIVHDGGSPQALQDISSWGVGSINRARQPASYFWWDYSDRGSPRVSSEHAVFTSGERLLELFENERNVNRQAMRDDFDNGLHFTENSISSGSAADNVTVSFDGKRTMFARNEDDGLYYVSQYNAPFVDGADGEQVAVTNILILQTRITQTGDYAGRLNIDLRSGGSGFYAGGGQYIPITWDSRGHSEPFSYFTAGGEPLKISPGKTYVCVVPSGSAPVFE
jgi:hypothetical protein